MTAPPGGGVYVSLSEIYAAQQDTARAVLEVRGEVRGLTQDMAEVQQDVTEIKRRQWPPIATSILGGSVVAVVAAVLGLVVK